MEQTKQLVQTITEGIQEKKGSGIVIADLTKITGAICRYFIVCQGSSPAQVEAIAESVAAGDLRADPRPTDRGTYREHRIWGATDRPPLCRYRARATLFAIWLRWL